MTATFRTIGIMSFGASYRLARLAAVLAAALLAGLAQTSAQTPSTAVAGVDAALLEDMVIGSRVLADFGVLDGFGHVSARHPTNPTHFLMARSLAPALVTADDIMEFDLDGNAVDARGRTVFLERFIHGEIYKARPDVMSVVHTHSPGVIPFSVTKVPLRAMFHNPSFLGVGVPVWDIRKDFGDTDMLVSNPVLGKSLAQTLGDKPVVLMRGHGDVAVGPSVKMAVFRAYYTDVNAKLQSQAIALGGEVTYLTPGEGEKGDKINFIVIDRIWNLWRMRILPTLAK
ncbi:class II aldolase/adducin family protein [Bradyrhizobium sp.]|jgi:ribulose-5-phosphate 4-epimerase/fuculose-1-phosphate aldolase|uniref:class II aldolase/adducin family protein n=1 Tax=Bradyrhizobium sp. TaxID=376 RepID=UPI0025C03C74|nr:class II aldolase/adducin family protein [Bradyrhizobium sp.]